MGRGRPPKDDGLKKPYGIRIRLNNIEREKLDRVARLKGVNRSELIRDFINRTYEDCFDYERKS